MDNVVRKQMMLLKNIKKALKSDLFDHNVQNQTTRTPELQYIASVRDRDQLRRVAPFLENYKGAQKVYHLETRFLEALYFDSADNFNALFLTVKEAWNSLDSAQLNYGNDSVITNELKQAMLEKKLYTLAGHDFQTTVNIICSMELSIAAKHQISLAELYYRKMVNTQKEFVKQYQRYRTDPNQIKSYNWKASDHLKSFALNYYAMIRVMADVYQSERERQGFTVHDAGTSTAQLALLLATLDEAALMGLKVKEIIASDLELGCMENARRYLNQSGASQPVRFVRLDFTDDSQTLPEADVTILNDVLEHFPTDEMAFHVFERFWQCTRKLFIIHVPQEAEPSVEWGHYITFNKAKLARWANRLTGHRSLGDDYRFNEDTQYSDCGFLFLKAFNR
jgi:2-polyprenyl-3-methyl-5-hydroxy-6-metoxy-1,4-benzoquinol methylase